MPLAGAVVATIRVCGMIGAGMSDDYLLGGQRSELDRLRLQSRVWEPAGVSFLERVPRVRGGRALDVGCGAMGWLRALSEWAGDRGEVVGTDIDAGLLQAAGALVEDEGLRNVTLVRDDLFSSALEPASFDLVHARFQLAPLGRMDEQIQAYARLVRDGGSLVLEEPDSSSWHFNPPGPSAERLIALILEAFSAGGGDFDAGRRLPELLGRVANVTGLDATGRRARARTPLSQIAPAVRHRTGATPAPARLRTSARRPSHGRRCRARRSRPLGHHVHTDPDPRAPDLGARPCAAMNIPATRGSRGRLADRVGKC